MQNNCLIIMPSGEPNGYPQGHVNRVYDFIIVPACRMAGFWPTRADNATYANPLDPVKEMIDSEIVLCDVSADNTNALYALAIRDALRLPVILVKDVKSAIAQVIHEQGVVEYDESLRIDTVQKAIETISETLKKAIENKKERNELLDRLTIGLPPVFVPTATPEIAPEVNTADPSPEATTEEEDSSVRYPIISPLPDYVKEPFTEAEINRMKAGDVFFHLNHGKGTVNFVKKMGKDNVANVQFESGPKLLVLVTSDFYRKIKK